MQRCFVRSRWCISSVARGRASRRESSVTNIDSQGYFFVRARRALSTRAASAEATLVSPIADVDGPADLRDHETRGSRALRVSMARAFPVRIAPLREALVNGSITKLARP